VPVAVGDLIECCQHFWFQFGFDSCERHRGFNIAVIAIITTSIFIQFSAAAVRCDPRWRCASRRQQRPIANTR
jgi:hypothetical protein